MKTLKVYKYRGVNVYIRHLYGEDFEYLIPWKGEMLGNFFKITKEPGKKLKAYTHKEFEKVVDTLTHIANTFIDDKKQGRIFKEFNKLASKT